ncbi:hypothetical protein Pedsa_1240 [Pseudopedobacter saltans DSM 12145]|uniref:DUF4290 domain-containing protein n=1 Tax=Pseudopedobacter saltans (strain ATCC 51119 / DSM 12145 / JCM 21818 / CCUG 39354 / LMG 10337 / NBRC 100064 / NCIMB 13643) TaxID=762903 RepID=F0SD51_PSESL|nr:DUF4290 domain-containing protein [Pseudopedobacter saltans]ADY51808.1 hypothetical protein Pedsa_1240 [Pseudopedobacter saltans DSM 12145]
MNDTNTEVFDYNTSRKKLILAEYGRNVQNMVEYICNLPTKEERNKYAQVVIDMMGFLNPHLRDVPDFKHKLWDHLHIISGFQIDVDSPYPVLAKESINVKPERLEYPQSRIRFKHYGHTIEMMIKKAKEVTDSEKKQHMVNSIANFMKMAYVLWNKDHVNDEQIMSDLAELSKGELDLSNVVIQKIDTKQTNNQYSGGSASRSQKSNNNNRNFKQNNNQNGKNRPRNYNNGKKN